MIPEGYFPNDAIEYVKLEFEERLRRRPHYSLRAFARDLEMSPASLSDFMAGKAGLSRERATFVAKRIHLVGAHADHFGDLIVSRYSRSEKARSVARIRSRNRIRAKTSELSLDQFRLIADWQHLAILELIELDSRFHDTDVLSKALGLKKVETRQSIERLERLELLIREESGVWRTSSPKTAAGNQAPSAAIRDFHRQMLLKAAAALESQVMDKRDAQTGVFSIRAADVPEIKADLQRQFHAVIEKFYHREDKDAVYCLSQQFFRLDGEMESS